MYLLNSILDSEKVKYWLREFMVFILRLIL